MLLLLLLSNVEWVRVREGQSYWELFWTSGFWNFVSTATPVFSSIIQRASCDGDYGEPSPASLMDGLLRDICLLYDESSWKHDTNRDCTPRGLQLPRLGNAMNNGVGHGYTWIHMEMDMGMGMRLDISPNGSHWKL